MYAEKYLQECNRVLREIEETQMPNIIEAAEVIADSIANGGVFHFASFMHMPNEPISRAGGLFLIHPIKFDFAIPAPPPKRESPSVPIPDSALEYALDKAGVKAGDTLLIVNNAGQADHIVGIALAAKRRNVTVIAITCPAYGEVVTSRHPSGKKLYEVADILIDNCGEIGDALVEIPGVEVKACPSSGVTEAYIVWALTAELLHQLVQRGLKPHVYMSNNLDQAAEFNQKARAEFEKTGV